MNGNVSRYDTQTIRKLMALSVAMMCVIAIVPNDLASDGIDWLVSDEPSMSVPPTIEENDTGSDKADSTPSIEAGNTTTNETPEIPETNGSTAEITETTDDDLPADIPPVEEVVEEEGETIPEDGEDIVEEPNNPDEFLEHLGGTGGMVVGINFVNKDGKILKSISIEEDFEIFIFGVNYKLNDHKPSNYSIIGYSVDDGEIVPINDDYTLEYHFGVVQVILE